jgi:hypothetical protein
LNSTTVSVITKHAISTPMKTSSSANRTALSPATLSRKNAVGSAPAIANDSGVMRAKPRHNASP